MRSTKIAPGEHYHVFNRGVGKNDIFFDERDKIRFLVSILYFQSSIIISNPSYYVSHFREHRVFPNSKKTLDKILENRVVELVNFCLMPNHFHLTLFEKEEGGISHYMQRIQNAYTKYFNTKYKKSGHLFEGPYKAVHIGSDEQLLYLSSYIHRNPVDLPDGRKNFYSYNWSSLIDYLEQSRWGELLKNEIILEQFESKSDYKNFIKTSPAKTDRLENLVLIDAVQ